MTSSNYFYLLIIVCTLLYHHHHHVVQLAQISLTLSHHFSLLFIASGRSSGLHPVSSHSCWMYVHAGRPAFARPYVGEGVHRSTSLMSSSLLLQQCPACLVRLTWIVFVMGGRWPYSWCFVECCRQDCLILLATFLRSCRLASSPAVLLASKWCIHTAVSTRLLLGRNCVSFYRSGLISMWPIAVHAFISRVSMSFRLMRHCFLVRWICQPVSERFRLVWKCRLLD